MGTPYDTDVAAWAAEQAAFLRERNWSALDIEHLAEEIESVARAEQRELGSRMAILLAHLLKWQLQPSRRCNSWLRTIRDQRRSIQRVLNKMPSLKPALRDEDWVDQAWSDAVALAARETGLDEFAEQLPWPIAQVLDQNFLPD